MFVGLADCRSRFLIKATLAQLYCSLRYQSAELHARIFTWPAFYRLHVETGETSLEALRFCARPASSLKNSEQRLGGRSFLSETGLFKDVHPDDSLFRLDSDSVVITCFEAVRLR